MLVVVAGAELFTGNTLIVMAWASGEVSTFALLRNWALVCLAVWLTFGSRSVSDKILAIVFPISAFVACGFEHSVANMYLIPVGLLAAGSGAESIAAGLAGNLLPVTLGNIVGGGVLVALVYWAAYLRPRK